MKILVEKKHPLAIRWNHWISFPVLFIMIWSGLLIYWANADYLIPREWLTAIGFGQRLGEGLGWHFAFAMVFVLNGIAYAAFLLFSKQWRYMFPDRRSLREATLVALHDIKIYKGPLPLKRKYNAAQRIAYTAVLFLGAGATITGFAIYKPVQLNWLLSLLGGYTAARWEHFLIMIAFLLFFVVHIVQVILAGWNNFRAMITGLEVTELETGDVD
jgi:thiosulfate reductase cytochrome b subunit